MSANFINPQPWERFGAREDEWRDWRWQQRHAVRTLDEAARQLALSPEETEGIRRAQGLFRFGATPYYLSLADREDPACPVRMQVVPGLAESRVRPGELRDPLGEDSHRPVASIVHKYPDRVLFLAFDRCAVYCRHCTRRRIAGGGEAPLNRKALEAGIAYVGAHPEVRDVLVSGGDPLLLSDGRLEALLGELRAIPHVQLLRIGTRVPVANPMRVTPALVATLRRFHPLFVVTHFNHPKEITPESRAACEALVDAGIPVENQSVLLRRINSSARILTRLSHELLAMRVRPYYLHQMDVAEGTEHLRTPVEAGLAILDAMRGYTSGLAVPHLAVDLPGGGGKVTLQPRYLLERDARGATFRNYRGERYVYPEPADSDCRCPYEDKYFGERG